MIRGSVLPLPSTPALLVSVRSAGEAREAVLGGAAVIDVKEPDRGPLGCADPDVWRAVRAAVPRSVPVSVALGELRDWIDRPPPPPGAFDGIAFRKVGLAGMARRDWRAAWGRLREALGGGPAWVAVAYLDADRAGAPSPDEVREEALGTPGCAGLLLDTWEKGRPADDRGITADWIASVRRGGRLVALAGGLDAEAIERSLTLGPDLFAVRGAACEAGERQGRVDRDRVRRLVGAIGGARLEATGPVGMVRDREEWRPFPAWVAGVERSEPPGNGPGTGGSLRSTPATPEGIDPGDSV